MTKSTTAAQTVMLITSMLQTANSLMVPLGHTAARPAKLRSSALQLALEGGSEPVVLVSRDVLMERTVEQQISAFGTAHDSAKKQYLYAEWTVFTQRARQEQNPGTMINFIGDLQRAETTSIFVPQKAFRQLSPGNPYAAQDPGGHHEEVQPAQIALRLISCRAQLAEYWVELMPSLLQLTMAGVTDVPTNEATTANATAAASSVAAVDATLHSYDRQLLFGIATKLAARQILKELSLRPSCEHMHDWLKSYLLVQHGNDLTALGSVERLHANLVAQPICIRGGAIVDPQDISLELFQRSIEILECMEKDLRDAPEQTAQFTAGFLESCLGLDFDL